MNKEFIECREVVENIKVVLFKEREGYVYDYQVADELKIGYSTLRVAMAKNKIPIREVALFCYKRDISLDSFIFKRKTT